MPVDHCPLGSTDAKGTNAAGELATALKQRGGFTWAQDQIWIRFEQLQQASWVANFKAYYSNDAAGLKALGTIDYDTKFRAATTYFAPGTP
jgi:hypothetical protein